MVNDDLFVRLCDVYGFAPSRALRELLDCAVGSTRRPLSQQYLADAWRDSTRECTGSSTELIEQFARRIERAHGIGS